MAKFVKVMVTYIVSNTDYNKLTEKGIKQMIPKQWVSLRLLSLCNVWIIQIVIILGVEERNG